MGDISVVPHPVISEIGLESDDLLPERRRVAVCRRFHRCAGLEQTCAERIAVTGAVPLLFSLKTEILT